MDTIRTHGRYLHKALPVHASVGNMARRVLKIVREEYAAGREVGFVIHCNPNFIKNKKNKIASSVMCI